MIKVHRVRIHVDLICVEFIPKEFVLMVSIVVVVIHWMYFVAHLEGGLMEVDHGSIRIDTFPCLSHILHLPSLMRVHREPTVRLSGIVKRVCYRDPSTRRLMNVLLIFSVRLEFLFPDDHLLLVHLNILL